MTAEHPASKIHPILVIDDEEVTRMTFALGLRHFGFEVLEARNVKQAKALIHAIDFKLILSDILLPDGDGLDVLKFVDQHKTPRPPVILMTGYPTEESRQTADTFRAYAYVQKPIKISKVVELIHEALNQAPPLPRQRGLLRDVLIPEDSGSREFYPVPLNLEERELLLGMVMHQLIELESYQTRHAQEGRQLLSSIEKKLRHLC
jgi:DNA-binding response OmpR family regulator